MQNEQENEMQIKSYGVCDDETILLWIIEIIFEMLIKKWNLVIESIRNILNNGILNI